MKEGLKRNVMPIINFFLFLRLNGSVNGLKPRIYYYNIKVNLIPTAVSLVLIIIKIFLFVMSNEISVSNLQFK